MKKLTSLVLAVLLAVGALAAFASCGSKQSEITISVPNDTTNEARALLLLESKGYIKLKEGAGIGATVLDITENPYNIKFNEVEAAAVPNVLKDGDYGVINANYAISAGLNPKTDALALEGSASAYGNILAVKEGNENNEAIKALAEILTGADVAQYINETFGGAVVPMNQGE